ncbi:dockerin type I domain-containing protein [Bacillus sp. 1P10SD]|uniref:dockerin type I domain-containing protein n=1 Tax=Bacillus sp. 1P10SD TaxID=3132265 RepID=UPI0039A6E8F2
MKEDTGAISFGNVVWSGKDSKDSREVTIENKGTEEKNFDVSVKFQSGVRGSQDAAKNGVVVNTDQSFKVPANSHVTRNVSLLIPATAEKGIYEGYIVYTNHDDLSETYQIPFGTHYVEEGFQEVKLDRQSMTTDRNNLANPFFYPYVWATINLKSHMRYVDVVLTDANTGEDLGLLGTFDSISRDENTPYAIAAFMGAYYPFTNDDNNPISSTAALAKEGHYKLKFIGYNDEGKTFINEQDLIVDNTMPSKFDVQVDGEKEGNPFIEYKADQQTVGMHASIQDKGVDVMNEAGIKANQSQNIIGYFYNSPWVSGLLPLDENGKMSDEIAMAPNLEVLNLRFEGVDQARNSYGNKQYFFVKEGTPYVYGQPNIKTRLNRAYTKIGDTVTITLTANNMNKLKEAVYNFTTKPVDTNIVNIALNPAAKNLGGQLNVTSTNPNSTSIKTDVKVTFDGSSEVTGDIPMVDVTIKIPEMKDVNGYSSFNFVNSTFTSVDNTVKKPFTYITPISILTAFSSVISYIHPEAFSNPDGTLIKTDFTKIGSNVTTQDSEGNIYTGSMDTRGQFYITGLPVTKDEFTVIQDIPGHFTTYGKFTDAYITIDGVMYGYSKRVGTETVDDAAAGDVNKDDVIDIMDALAIQNDWGTNKHSSDINFDGTVDARDFAFVEKNFLMKNPTVDHAPKAEKQYKGKTLVDIKKDLGIQ